MATWSNATVTNKGYALQAKLLSTDALSITRVVSGAGRVTAGQLVSQTGVSDIAQTLTVEALSYDGNGNAIIKVSLNNTALSTGYTCNQIGIYATDPDEGEILYAIAQEATVGQEIPSITAQPNGYFCSWVFSLTFSTATSVSVTIDPANALTKDAADVFYAAKTHIHDMSAVTGLSDALSGKASTSDLEAAKPFYVTCTVNSSMDEFGTPDKTVAEVTEAVEAGREVLLVLTTGTAKNVFMLRQSFPSINAHIFSGVLAYVEYNITYGTGGIGCEYRESVGEMLDSFAVVIGRATNEATGSYSVACGGTDNTASGENSFTCGESNTAYDRQFVIGGYADTSDTAKGAIASYGASVGSAFVIGNGVVGSPKNIFRVAASGTVYGASSVNGTGADNAEFYEWLDGNPDNEDRIGRFVTLDGKYIRLATADDDDIEGVVSDTDVAAFIGDCYADDWKGRYLKDVFGRRLTESVHIDAYTDDEGIEHPEVNITRFKENPEYDSTQPYVSREDRPEWAVVSLSGKNVIIDDGTCQVNGYVKPTTGGIGTAAEGKTAYRVMERIDESHVRIRIKNY